MRTMKTTILSFALLLMVVLGVNGQPVHPGVRPSDAPKSKIQKGPDHQGMMKALNLTDEQKEAFKKIMLAIPKEIKPLRNELGEAAAHQRTLISADKPDMTAINKNIDKMGALKTEMAEIEMKYRLERRALLTDEQRLRAEGMKAKLKNTINQKKARPALAMKSAHHPQGPVLNLTKDQKEAIQKIRLSMSKEIKPIRNEMGEALAHQRTLISADKPDIGAINKNIEKIETLKTNMVKITTRDMLEIRDQLTDVQKLRLDVLKARRKYSIGQRS